MKINWLDHGWYSKDKCAQEVVEKKSLEELGCTTPFGPHKNQICQNPEDITKVKEIYSDKIEKHLHKCQSPCSFFSIMTIMTKDSYNYFNPSLANLEIHFKENIKVTTGYYLYSELSLIAEIGGYVGLFLGVSINQITNLIEWILNSFNVL